MLKVKLLKQREIFEISLTDTQIYKKQQTSVPDFSRIPVNKGTNSRLGWTKYSDLCEIVHPSLILISLCFLIGAECGKGALSGRFQTLIWRPREMVQKRESPPLSRRVDSTADCSPYFWYQKICTLVQRDVLYGLHCSQAGIHNP